MKNLSFNKAVLLGLFVLMTILCVAQPPGGGMPPGGRPPGRPPMGDRNREWNQNMGNMPVKPKKKVREGDTFKVVG